MEPDIDGTVVWLVVGVLAAVLASVLLVVPTWLGYLLVPVLVLMASGGLLVLQCISERFSAMISEKACQRMETSTFELARMRKCLKELERESLRAKRLPAVFGRMIDDSLQQLIDLCVRDYVAAWNAEQGFSFSEQLAQDVKEDLWRVIQNLQERLSKVDEAKLICVDFTTRILQHLQHIRLTKAAVSGGQPPAYQLLPHLHSIEAEKAYLRQVTSALLILFFPASYTAVEPIKHMLRELLTCKILLPAIEALTDPDFINEKILTFIELTQPQAELQQNNTYERPESYEDFIRMIKRSPDIEVLKHIRYDIVSEILSATNEQNLTAASKGMRRDGGGDGGGDRGGGSAGPGQVKRYVQQLAYAKSQCERRLHELGWMGYPAVEEAAEASLVFDREPLSLQLVLGSPKGRTFLGEYLQQVERPALVGYWGAVEELRQSSPSQWHAIGAEIFYTYIRTPTAPMQIDKTVCKRMETFLLGDSGPEVFYELQDIVLQTLGDELYPSFVLTDLYQKAMTAMESIEVDEHSVEYQISAAMNDDLDPDQSTEDQSNYERRKLSQLRDRLQNKVRALCALRTSLKPESRVLAQLGGEVDRLRGEVRQLEAHLERTEAWGEHLGQWRAVVQTAELSEEKGECPQFVLVVHVQEDEQDTNSVSTGWVVLRKLQDFQDLHRKLCQLSSGVKHLELPSQSLKFRLGKTTVKNALEKAKVQIQKYLQFVLEDERLNQSEALYTFLSPSSEHLKQVGQPVPKKSKFSFSTMFKSGGWDPSTLISAAPAREAPEDPGPSLLLDEAPEPGSKGPAWDPKDAIAEPLYSLLNELCDLNATFKWIRRTLITTVQLTYNRSINRAIRLLVAYWFSEPNVYYYIQLLTKAWWPNGQLSNPLHPRTQKEKLRRRDEARDRLLNSIPLMLSNLVGQQSARMAATKVFDALQEPILNKQILYELLDVLLYEVCPELKAQ